MSKRPQRRTAFYTARKAKGLTQVELSRLSGVAQTIISELEKGENINPTWSVLSRIAQVLGVRPDQLLPYTKLPKSRLVPLKIGDPLHVESPLSPADTTAL